MAQEESFELNTYLIYLKDFDPIEVVTNLDVKAKFWDAKKCHYPTFEVFDADGESHVFVTESIMLLSTKTRFGTNQK